MISPATRYALDKPRRISNPRISLPIKEQRYLLPPKGSPSVMKFYPLDSLLKTANYLIRVEDRMLPVAFFAEPRHSFKGIIGLLKRVRQWKAEGYTHVLMIHGADPTVSVHQPFGKYYVWSHRLKTLKHIEPVKKP